MLKDQTCQNRNSSAAEARERIAEIGEILAVGLQRLYARKSSELSRQDGESSLASLGHQSGAVLRNGEGDRA